MLEWYNISEIPFYEPYKHDKKNKQTKKNTHLLCQYGSKIKDCRQKQHSGQILNCNITALNY